METLASGEPAFKRDSLPVRNHRPPDRAAEVFGELVESRRRRDYAAAKRATAALRSLGWQVVPIPARREGGGR